MSFMRLRPPLGCHRRLLALSKRGCVPSQRHSAQLPPHLHSFSCSTSQTVTTSVPTAPSYSPPPLTPAASLLAAFLAHPPPSPLPASLLSSAALLTAELRLLHRSLPFFVGFSSQLPLPGSHFTVECGGVSVVVIRGEDRVVRALFNNCTHQNARICASSRPDLALHSLPPSATPLPAPPLQSTPTCHYATRLVCPFHHWTFGLDGSHLAPRTPLTRDPEQRKAFALRRATVEELDGVLWVRMKVETDESTAAYEVAAEVADERRAVQQRLAGLSSIGCGSLLLHLNWKAVLSALSHQPDSLPVFPSAVYTSDTEPLPLLLQLLPLSEWLTAVTAYGVGTEAEVAAGVHIKENADGQDWQQWVNTVTASAERGGLEGEHSAQYHQLMVAGLSAEVAVEDKQRQEVEARRNKLLGTQ